jgi:hypothetical protein
MIGHRQFEFHQYEVDRLCERDHPVEAGLRPEKTVKLFKEAIDHNYVHVKFTKTRGGTELGVRLDRDAYGNVRESETGMAQNLSGVEKRHSFAQHLCTGLCPDQTFLVPGALHSLGSSGAEPRPMVKPSE